MTVHFNEPAIKDILLKEEYVGNEDLQKAEIYAKDHQTSFLEYLLNENIISRDIMGQAIAKSCDVSYADLNSHQPTKEQILRLPETLAREFRAVIFSESDDTITIATDNPGNTKLTKDIGDVLKKDITISYSLTEDIDHVLQHYAKPLETRFSKILKDSKRVAPEILDEIFSDALSLHVSDIHFEPRAKDVEVRFRLDGVLYLAGRIPKEHYGTILNRLKVLSNERIDEHQSAQDGSLRFTKNGVSTDMRSSIVPTVDGEKVVLRILMSYVEGFGLSDLGLSPTNQKLIEEAAAKPFGMIITSGPTGSGKTTTLYSLIKKMNGPGVNITTIEDPVEYKIDGANQIQVNAATGLTFANGLRSIVRQDPDIILVGEIRDEETAEISINAALTGHLLFSTFHANDAATVIPRLLDMKIEPFLTASTIILIISQRLVRKLCDQCRKSTEVKKKTIEEKFPHAAPYFTTDTITLYESSGCESCNHTGYRGRTGVFEIIKMTPEIHDLVLKCPSSHEIWDMAQQQGSRSLFEDGIEKVMSGLTTLDELLRVVEIPEEKRVA